MWISRRGHEKVDGELENFDERYGLHCDGERGGDEERP